MRKLILLTAVATTMLALPGVASAHKMSKATARGIAAEVCRDINQVDPQVNPYVCVGTLSVDRRNLHSFIVGLQMRDPNDGEECAAVIKMRYRSRVSRRIVVSPAAHNCGADPFAGL